MFSAVTRASSNITCPNSFVMPLIIAQRPLLDAGLVHRHRERGEALVLRDVGIGAREQQAPVGDVGVARPDLVAVDHVLVAVARRGRAQRREVGAGVGLAEALAPALAAADEAGEEAVLDRLAAVRRDALHEIAETRTRRRARGRELLVEDHVEHGRQVVTAEPRGPAQPEEARRRRARCAIRPAVPSTRRRSTTSAGPGCARRATPGSGRGTRLRRASHESPSATPSRSRCELAQLHVVVAEPLRREQRAPQVHVRDALPRVADAAVHLHRRLAHRARGAGAVRLGDPAGGARLGGREVVDRPRRVQRDAERTFHQAARFGEQVLHGLERADRNAVLPALGRVRDGHVEHAAHHADEVGAREREAERGPRGEVVVGEEPRRGRRPRRTGVPAGIVRTARVRSVPPRGRRRPAPARGGSPRLRAPARSADVRASSPPSTA